MSANEFRYNYFRAEFGTSRRQNSVRALLQKAQNVFTRRVFVQSSVLVTRLPAECLSEKTIFDYVRNKKKFTNQRYEIPPPRIPGIPRTKIRFAFRLVLVVGNF